MQAADSRHREAIKLLHSWWRSLSREHESLADLTILQKASSAADQAESAYLTLIEKWPSCKSAFRAYGIFLLNVRCDPEQGRQCLQLGEDVDDDLPIAGMEGDERSALGSSSHPGSRRSGAGSVAQRSGQSSGTRFTVNSIRSRKLAVGKLHDPRFLAPVVRRARAGLCIAGILLLACIGGLIGSIRTLLDATRESIVPINTAGLRRRQVQTAFLALRHMRLAQLENNTIVYDSYRTELLNSMRDLHAANECELPRTVLRGSMLSSDHHCWQS